jgi:hypothetical protein
MISIPKCLIFPATRFAYRCKNAFIQDLRLAFLSTTSFDKIKIIRLTISSKRWITIWLLLWFVMVWYLCDFSDNSIIYQNLKLLSSVSVEGDVNEVSDIIGARVFWILKSHHRYLYSTIRLDTSQKNSVGNFWN